MSILESWESAVGFWRTAVAVEGRTCFLYGLCMCCFARVRRWAVASTVLVFAAGAACRLCLLLSSVAPSLDELSVTSTSCLDPADVWSCDCFGAADGVAFKGTSSGSTVLVLVTPCWQGGNSSQPHPGSMP